MDNSTLSLCGRSSRNRIISLDFFRQLYCMCFEISLNRSMSKLYVSYRSYRMSICSLRSPFFES